MGLTSSLIILGPTILMMLLFRKAVHGTDEASKNTSRFDKVIEDAVDEGKIILPEKSFTRSLRPEERNIDGTRKIVGWPGYCYFIAWAVTIISIGKDAFGMNKCSHPVQCWAWPWSQCTEYRLATTRRSSGSRRWLLTSSGISSLRVSLRLVEIVQ
jgi:hypothetical protein